MLALCQVTEVDHEGAVWWAETLGQFGSPERLIGTVVSSVLGLVVWCVGVGGRLPT